MDKIPVLFVGHGSPMNAIEDNIFSREWKTLKDRIPEPKAIICFSAHWYTKGTKIMNQSKPKIIYDMYGFPKELYEVKYPVKGSSSLADRIRELIENGDFDSSWGIDHGTWSVLVHMYPEGDIPVIQVSINALASPEEQYKLGESLKPLREEGYLILGSGNIVHNLRLVDWNIGEEGFPFAKEFDDFIHDNTMNFSHGEIINYKNNKNAREAVPTPDHFYPFLIVLGASGKDKPEVFNRLCTLGSLTMTSYLFK